MKMYANGWKKYDNVYAVQVNDIKQGDKVTLNKLFKEWNESGNGWNVKTGEQLVIYSKSFEDQKDWLAWAKKCPIKLYEIKLKSGKEERVQLTLKERKKREKNAI